MPKFRIKIDLSAFFDDEQKLVFILVDPAWESVKCLQKRVEKMFDVDNLRFTTNEGCFLPPQESIEIIKPNDVLKAFIPSESLLSKKKKLKKDKKDLVQETLPHKNLINVDDFSKKRKFLSLDAGAGLEGFTSSTPNTAKRSKNMVALSSVGEITSTNDHLEHLQKKKSTAKDCNSRLELEDSLREEQNNSTSSPAQNDHSMKRKRKRKRKTDSLVELGAEPMKAPSQVTTSTLLNASELSNQTTKSATLTDANKSHIYFNETGETVTTTTRNNSTISKSEPQPVKDSPPKISFRCAIENLSKVPRVFTIKKVEENNTLSANAETTTNSMDTSKINSTSIVNPIKEPIAIQECIVINPPLHENSTNITCAENEKESDANFSKLRSSEEEDDLTCAEIKAESDANSSKLKSSEEEDDLADESSVIEIESEEENASDSKNCTENDTVKDISEVIDLNMSDEDSQPKVNKMNSDEVSIEKMLPFSTDLNDLPSIGNIVIFKIMREDNNMSNYIAGKCEYTNKRTKNIRMVIIDGQLRNIPKKYICSTIDDSIASEDQCLQVKLTEMLEAKVFEMD